MSSTRKIIALVVKIKKWLFGPTTKFKVGDSVQLKSGGYLMVIVEVCKNRKMKRCLLHCQWFDSEFQSSRWNLFPEKSLKFFDWYAAKDVDQTINSSK